MKVYKDYVNDFKNICFEKYGTTNVTKRVVTGTGIQQGSLRHFFLDRDDGSIMTLNRYFAVFGLKPHWVSGDTEIEGDVLIMFLAVGHVHYDNEGYEAVRKAHENGNQGKFSAIVPFYQSLGFELVYK